MKDSIPERSARSKGLRLASVERGRDGALKCEKKKKEKEKNKKKSNQEKKKSNKEKKKKMENSIEEAACLAVAAGFFVSWEGALKSAEKKNELALAMSERKTYKMTKGE